MQPAKKPGKNALFDHFSSWVTHITGRPVTFISAIVIVLVWAVSGPIFHFSDTWQLVINTGTTIITFLMVFVIQQSQNKDTVAIHLKLNELIAANENASNRLVAVEDLTEEELIVLKEFYIHLSELSDEDCELYATHSIDEAKHNQAIKAMAKQRNITQKHGTTKPTNRTMDGLMDQDRMNTQ